MLVSTPVKESRLQPGAVIAIAPVPDPPATLNVTDDPTVADSDEAVKVNVFWDASVKVTVTGSDVFDV